MLDAVHFEGHGVPAVAILTEPFASTGGAIAELAGFAHYPFATVPHPIGSLTVSGAMAVADAVTPIVLGLLTGAAAGASSATAVTAADLDDVVNGLAEGLRTGGADLTASVTGREICLQLHLPDAACAECVMPASVLAPMFRSRIEAELCPGWTITLGDPREPEAAPAEVAI